jgi:hypothetical protein
MLLDGAVFGCVLFARVEYALRVLDANATTQPTWLLKGRHDDSAPGAAIS